MAEDVKIGKYMMMAVVNIKPFGPMTKLYLAEVLVHSN